MSGNTSAFMIPLRGLSAYKLFDDATIDDATSLDRAVRRLAGERVGVSMNLIREIQDFELYRFINTRKPLNKCINSFTTTLDLFKINSWCTFFQKLNEFFQIRTNLIAHMLPYVIWRSFSLGCMRKWQPSVHELRRKLKVPPTWSFYACQVHTLLKLTRYNVIFWAKYTTLMGRFWLGPAIRPDIANRHKSLWTLSLSTHVARKVSRKDAMYIFCHSSSQRFERTRGFYFP